MIFSSSNAEWTNMAQNEQVAILPLRHRDWFCDSGSLTARFKSEFQEQVHFKLLRAEWGRALAEECSLLNSVQTSDHWLREIAWSFGHECWVVARVVIPPLQENSPLQQLLAWGGQSIGNFLFSNAAIVQQPFQVMQLTETHPYFNLVSPWLEKSVNLVWARRRIFTLQTDTLLVSEIFLPQFFQHQFTHVK